MANHINFRKIYKEAFISFRKYKLLRVFGVAQTASELMLFLSTTIVGSLLDFTYRSDTIDSELLLFYYLTIIVFIIFIVGIYLVIKNWAIASLTASINIKQNSKPVSIASGSLAGKIYLYRLITLDIIIWLYYIMFYFLLSSTATYLIYLFPVFSGLITYLALIVKLIFFFIGASTVIYGTRAIIVDDKKAVKAVQIGFNFFKNNILNTFLIVVVNLSMIAPFFITFTILYLTANFISLYFADLNPVISLFFYSLAAATVVLVVLTSWIFYGSYQVFVNSVWTMFYKQHPLREKLIKKYNDKKR